MHRSSAAVRATPGPASTSPDPPAGDGGEGRPGRAVPAARLGALAALLFVSGACALVYQVTWLRELRLVFGAATPATAAVLAIFMGGLGIGSAWLGPRADRVSRPLRLYAQLELAIAVTAVATPLLLWLVRLAYVGVGGTSTLGPYVGTAIRIVLAVLVLGPPAVLMGGTLPAAARLVATDPDRSRGRLGLLYGMNALGAVTGAALATFALLELLGARATIFVAAAANLAVAVAAFRLGASAPAERPNLRLAARAADRSPARPAAGSSFATVFVLAAAALVGAAFFLMEIVWYRMLAPLLGGSTYGFGAILAVALLGVGLGGLGYGLVMRGRRAGTSMLALTCTLEAVLLALPYALGDRLAILAVLLRPLGQFEFAGLVAGWVAVASIVVLAPAVVAGFQFPLLLGLLGEGREDVGRDTGAACAWNTAGAIVGSLAGGFGLLPALTAPGLWRLVTILLALLGAATLAFGPRRGRFGLAGAMAVTLAVAAVLLVTRPTGPTAAWRHSSIGAGRVGTGVFTTRNRVTGWLHDQRRSTLLEIEGRESSIAAVNAFGIALKVGGASDGNVIGDAGTQVMLGMLGAFLHPRPRKALVIGLGTGTSAGWLGSVPSIERVDVAELEPEVARVAALCAPVNQDALSNPKVRLRIGDGRELLLTSRERYDLIASEPSNPYRAGVASLFTQEFYRAAARRLADDGLFLQWTQIYEIDFRTLRTVLLTISKEFGNVEAWATLNGDLLLVASKRPLVSSVDALRARLQQEPFRSAMAAGWGATNLEGVLARYIGNGDFTRYLAGSGPALPNTDDRTVLEYAFARQTGGPNVLSFDSFRSLALERGEHLPSWSGGPLDANLIMIQRASMLMMESIKPPTPPRNSPLYPRGAAMASYLGADFPATVGHWRSLGSPLPADLTETAMIADAMAEVGDEAALAHIEGLRPLRPVEADLALARLRLRRGQLPAATRALESALVGLRRNPWSWPQAVYRGLTLAIEIAEQDPATSGRRLLAALELPFAAYCSNQARLDTRLRVAQAVEGGAPGEAVRAALAAYEPHVPWTYAFLSLRASTYARLGDARAERARLDLQSFLRDSPSQPSGLTRSP